MAALHPEMMRTMHGKGVQLDERARIEECLDPLTRCTLTTLMLLLYCDWIGGRRLGPPAPQLLDFLLGRSHRREWGTKSMLLTSNAHDISTSESRLRERAFGSAGYTRPVKQPPAA